MPYSSLVWPLDPGEAGHARDRRRFRIGLPIRNPVAQSMAGRGHGSSAQTVDSEVVTECMPR